MWHALLNGAFIRWCACLSAVLTTFLAPQWIGANEFGIAVAVLAIPYFVQGLCEPIVITLSISQLNSPAGYEGLAKVRNDLGLATISGAVASLVFAWQILPRTSPESPLACAVLAAVFFLVAMANTWLIGLAYAFNEHSTLMRAFAGAGIAQIALLWLLKSLGSAAFLLGLIAGQGAMFAVLWSCPVLRQGFQKLIRAKREPSVRLDYLTILSLRASMLLLNTGTVILAGLLLAPTQVAAFRICIALAGAMNYLVPLNPQVLQARLTGSDAGTRRSAKWLLAGAFMASAALSTALYAGSNLWLPFLLPDQTAVELDGTIFLAMPCFLLIQPLSSYVFATDQAWILRWSTLGCALAFAAGAIGTGPGMAFAAGAVAHLAATVGLMGWTSLSRNLSVMTGDEFQEHPLGNPEIMVQKAA
jgi:hypothetical protein